MTKKIDDGVFSIEVISEDKTTLDLPRTLEGCATCHTCGGGCKCSCHPEYDENDEALFSEDDSCDTEHKITLKP